MSHHDAHCFAKLNNKYRRHGRCQIVALIIFLFISMPLRRARETDPILPTVNMAANGKFGTGKKRVLVVGAGAAGRLLSCDQSGNV